jgi:hypothetical protein
MEKDFDVVQYANNFNLTFKVTAILITDTYLLQVFSTGIIPPVYELAVIKDIPNLLLTSLLSINNTSTPGNFTYFLLKNPEGTPVTEYSGKLVIREIQYEEDSIENYITSELPINISLNPTFLTKKINFWKLFLQVLTNPIKENPIADDSWSSLEKALIAKLVVYDALLLASKGSFMAFMDLGQAISTSSDSSGGVKHIVTGPSEVEFFDKTAMIKEMFKKQNKGISPFEGLTQDVCYLASRLRIRLPMCNQLVNSPVIPFKITNPNWVL